VHVLEKTIKLSKIAILQYIFIYSHDQESEIRILYIKNWLRDFIKLL